MTAWMKSISILFKYGIKWMTSLNFIQVWNKMDDKPQFYSLNKMDDSKNMRFKY